MDTFEAALAAITNGCLYMFYLQKLKNDSLQSSKGNFDAFAELTSTAKIKLCWWDKHLHAHKPYLMNPQNWQSSQMHAQLVGVLLVKRIPQEETGPQKNLVSILIH